MTFGEAIKIVEKEFDLIYDSPHAKVVRTGLTYDGCRGFCVSIYDSEEGALVSDLGETKEVFDEVEEAEWKALCEEHGFRFVHWRIIRDFTGIEDLYEFIRFLDFISDKYWSEDD